MNWIEWLWQKKSVTAMIPVLFLLSCSSVKPTGYSPVNKYPPEALREDFSTLKKIFDANHPSLYWYSTKDSIENFYDEIYSSLTDSLAEVEFKNRITWWVTKIRDGHTTVQSSNGRLVYLLTQHTGKRFPLYLKSWKDSLIVILDLNKDSLLKRGTVITSIDGHSNRYIMDSMFQFISTDGYADNFKNQALSFNFPLYYSFAFPVKDSFDIRFIDSTGIEKNMLIPAYDPRKDSSETKRRKAEFDQLSEREKRRLRLLDVRNMVTDENENTAYMRVASFSGGKLRSFFSRSFKSLQQDGIKNLIIDLRENTGGSITVSGKLLRYLIDHPFTLADTVAAVNRSLPLSKYMQPSFIYRIAMFFTTKRKSDGKFHYTALEKKVHHPLKNNHFAGNIYIIQGGFTFSSATMVSAFLKGQSNVTVVGEESGGGSYGTSAVYLPVITLPNTRLRVTLPLYRIVFNKNNQKTGRGIFPDLWVPPSSKSIREGFDPKLKTIEALIKEQEKNL